MKCSICDSGRSHGFPYKESDPIPVPCAGMFATEEYNGWSNRETWAANLHMTNDEGWSDSLYDAVFESHAKGDTKYGTGHAIEQVYNDYLDGMADLPSTRVIPHMENFEMVLRDVGSVWRINWVEIAEAHLSGLEE